jgi:prepilin-type processing-associated H-X9-DG protein
MSSYSYLYVPAGGDWYYWGPGRTGQYFKGVFPDLERHNIGQVGAESRAVVSEGTATPTIMPGRPKPHGWHGDGGNVLYLDGHVVWVDSAAVIRAKEQAGTVFPTPPPFNPPTAGERQGRAVLELRTVLKALDRAAGG